ncbi:translation elongation factor EF-1 subunit alpha [archaeon]|nr:MAG: translation elongation factor EF-1 subunit alpha [archaeon]
MPEKPHLNLVVIGHVDHGKSTLMGHLLYKAGVIDERTIQKYEEEAKQLGKESFKYAWVLDKLKEERERGLTIDLFFTKFETPHRYYTIIDAPGHRDFIKNMITGTSQADIALLVVSAKKGEYEAVIGFGGQTREHVFLAKTLGVKHLIVAINKMDDATVNWSKERFEEVKNGIEDLLKKAGYDVNKVPIIPVSAWTGDNLLERSDKMPWYDGPTLFEALDAIEPPSYEDEMKKPLRIPIQDVYSISGVGTVPVGRVETGVLKPGDKVIFEPAHKIGEVKSIEMHHTRIDMAKPGDNIGFNVRGVARHEIRRGDVAGHPDNPPTVVEEFIGQVVVIYHPTAISAGYTPVLHAHTARTPVVFAELLKKIDPRTGQVVEENPKFLKTGDAAIVKFIPIKPVVLEVFKEFPALGRFAIRDSGFTCAVGLVLEITKKKEYSK